MINKCWCFSSKPMYGYPKGVGFRKGVAEIKDTMVQVTQVLDRFGPQDA